MDEDFCVGHRTIGQIMAPPECEAEPAPARGFRRPSTRSGKTRERVRACLKQRGGKAHLGVISAALANGKQKSNHAAAVSTLLVMAQQGEVRVLNGDYFELIKGD